MIWKYLAKILPNSSYKTYLSATHHTNDRSKYHTDLAHDSWSLKISSWNCIQTLTTQISFFSTSISLNSLPPSFNTMKNNLSFASCLFVSAIITFVIIILISILTPDTFASSSLDTYLNRPWYRSSGSYYYTTSTPTTTTKWTVSFKTVTAQATACVDVPTTSCVINNDAVLSRISDLQKSLDSYKLSLSDNDLQCVDLNLIANDIINIANQIRTLKQDITTTTQSCNSASKSTEMFSVSETITSTKTKIKTIYKQVLPWTGVKGL